MSKKSKTPFAGGCACGAIRYTSTAEPVLMLHCHCRDCQRASGGPFSSFVIVPKEAFELTKGSPRFHDSLSEAGGETHRGFCAECGSPIAVYANAAPQLPRPERRAWTIRAGSNCKWMCGSATRTRGIK